CVCHGKTRGSMMGACSVLASAIASQRCQFTVALTVRRSHSDQPSTYGARDRFRDLLLRARRIDDADAIGLLAGALEIRCPHALEECTLLALETIRIAARVVARLRARACDLD